ncbi:hypothetical protein K7W42_02025 [Deinococcus sp. HMF7604]|uniref:hypothetical protein n=1 Tax=Deinococcus betulae TaxID=2873312 RepID=UPI001CCC1AB5|nr:hypothetical protein [Deinococcus betulae]MBZ9749634.1 hypothetical protein [Deinococcus betulae]
MPFQVMESSIRARSGQLEDSADLLVVTPHHIALVAGLSFGATTGGARPHDLPPARFAAVVGAAALRDLPPSADLRDAADRLTRALSTALGRTRHGEARLQVAFALAAVSAARREVWQLGAVGAHWDGGTAGQGVYGLPNQLPSLAAAAQARAVFLHALLARGDAKTAATLRHDDPAQVIIAPLLTAHAALANTTGPFGYGLVDGRPVPDEHLRVHVLPPGPREVCLATGGYPAVLGTLQATERHLEDVLAADPLLTTRFPYVRPQRPGQDGYADRAYVRVRVW